MLQRALGKPWFTVSLRFLSLGLEPNSPGTAGWARQSSSGPAARKIRACRGRLDRSQVARVVESCNLSET